MGIASAGTDESGNSGPNRRRHDRKMSGERAGLVVALAGKDEFRVAALLDYSASGFRIRHDLALKQGDFVKILIPARELHARVMWTKETPEGKEAGLSGSLSVEEPGPVATRRVQ